MIPKRLQALRAQMADRGMAAYLVATSDFHASEYVGDYFKLREYLSGFSGSAGTLVVLPDAAGLWTDSRYFLQAEQELAGSGIDLYRMGEKDVPTVAAFLLARLPQNAVIGADGRTLSTAWCKQLLETLAPKQATLACQEDVAGALWQGRPALPQGEVFLLPVRYTGCEAAQKLAALRQTMCEKQADAHLLTTLDDIAWLLNIRGSDVQYNPVALCYAVVEPQRVLLFIDEGKLSAAVREALAALGVVLRPYGEVNNAMRDYAGKRVLLSSEKVNYALYSLLESSAVIIDSDNPTIHAKTIKNETELANLRRAHQKDGVAMVKLLHWLKTSDPTRLTERAVAQKADALRLAQEGCVSPSFTTIAGYGAHGAVVHYHATEATDAPLRPEGLLLLDSGGQYYEGTTDITRTIVLGPLCDEQRLHFSLVLRGMLELSHATFPEGCRGFHLDALARLPLWQHGLDFGHGTGHGIGYMLCVHEPPIGFSWRRSQRYDTAPLQPGMVLSDEPGVYIAGSHGIRHENQLACRRAAQQGFLCFETLTLVPFDREGIDPAVLGEQNLQRLNAYHARVYEQLAPLLGEEEQQWLWQATRPIQ